MADYNPFAELGKGMDSGADYAAQQVNLNLAKEQAQRQKDALGIQKAEFETRAGKQFADMLEEAHLETNPKIQKVLVASAQNWAKAANMNVDPTLWANIESQSPDLTEIFKEVGAADPQVKAAVYANLFKEQGRKWTTDVLKQDLTDIRMIKAAQIKGDATAKAAQTRTDNTANNLKFRQQKDATGQYNTQTNLETQRINGVGRMFSLLNDPKVTKTAQIQSILEAEFNRLEAGTNVIADASEKRKAMESLQQVKANLIQKVTGQPQDAISTGFKKQMVNTITDLLHDYQRQYDSKLEVLKAGAPEAAQEILSKREEAFRGDIKKHYGHWGKDEFDAQQAEKKKKPGAVTAGADKTKTPDLDSGLLQKAMGLKVQLAKLQGDERAAALEQIKKKVPAQYLDKVGIK